MSDVLISGVAILAFALVVFLVMAIKYPDIVREFFRSVDQLEISPQGIRVTRAVREAEQAVIQKERQKPDSKRLRENLKRISSRTQVLWVDDNPRNNTGETRVLKDLGLQVDTALSNDAAVSAASLRRYDLIISDINRHDEDPPDAGLYLPSRLASVLPRVPPIVYYTGYASSSQTPNGYPVTDVPSALFEAIQSALSLSDRSG